MLLALLGTVLAEPAVYFREQFEDGGMGRGGDGAYINTIFKYNAPL